MHLHLRQRRLGTTGRSPGDLPPNSESWQAFAVLLKVLLKRIEDCRPARRRALVRTQVQTINRSEDPPIKAHPNSICQVSLPKEGHLPSFLCSRNHWNISIHARVWVRYVLLAGVLCYGAHGFASDLLLTHGHIYTANPSGKWAQALAISGDKIDAIGTDAEILRLRQPTSKVIDLGGKTVLPGFNDDHVHLWFGSLALHGFNLSTPELNIKPDDTQAFTKAVKAYVTAHPHEAVYFGRAPFAELGEKMTATHELLDKIMPDRPMVIHATSEHALFVNGKALALAGIGDQPVADAEIERYIDRDANGHPTGVLREGAMERMERALPDPPLSERLALLHAGEQFLNSYGVTSIVAATGGPKDLANYDELRKHGLLTLRIRQAFGSVAVNHHLTADFLADLEKARSQYHDDWIQANEVKFFMDGDETAPLYRQDDYIKLVTELDRRNMHVMSHATTALGGTRALDGLEAVTKVNGPKDRRFRIEHAYFIAPGDIARYGRLGMIASMQPAFCCYSFAIPGEPEKQSQWNSVEKGGAVVAFSSDWPCSWPPSPLMGVQTATVRELLPGFDALRNPGVPPKYDDPGERLTVEQAVLAYTRNAAFANFMDDKLGTLEAGKLADLIVISDDIFAMPHEKIGQTKVTATMVGGKVVYGRLPQ